jgi:hypothetical protein
MVVCVLQLVDGRESIHPVIVIRADDTHQKHPYLAEGHQATLLEQAVSERVIFLIP